MIKLKKDIYLIPNSLQIPDSKFFSNSIPRPSRTTHKRRLEIIANKKYTNNNVNNSRYKQNDTKTALKGIYNNKCAFCETKVEQSHVEHYRPKDIYYWLAYSWDNLLLACSNCNSYKGTNFDLVGTKAVFTETLQNFETINISSSVYDKSELPKMVNPEVTNPDGQIFYKKNGLIGSNDMRFAYTIEKCKIDRVHLNDARRKIIDVFQRDIRCVFIENSTIKGQKSGITTIINKFLRDSKDIENEYIGFRRYTLINWLNSLVKEIVET